jgi:S-adenosylmethionine:tRNA ribosyltransferase-isomerase
MRAATLPVQRPADAKLLAIDGAGRITHGPRDRLVDLLRAGDLVVANDAATLPASLVATHVPSGAVVEVRLAQRASLDPLDVRDFVAVLFGGGDHRVRTEKRAAPPSAAAGDTLRFEGMQATITSLQGHARLVSLRFEAGASDVWAFLAARGKPIQYAYVQEPLALWDVWTGIASMPAAFEPPSAGFVLDWQLLARLRWEGIGFATLTHAAGISSTGDAALDARLPFDEPYRIPRATVQAIEGARRRGGRVVAVGTTVVRALESAADAAGRVRAGDGIATTRIGPGTALEVVDAIVSGTHERGTSHYELLRAFTDDLALRRADRVLEAHGYRTHEFGDSVFVERNVDRRPKRAPVQGRTA